jgi:uncharacterized protein YecA (UPF0149 family)
MGMGRMGMGYTMAIVAAAMSSRGLRGPSPSMLRFVWRGPKYHVGRNEPCPCGSGRKFKRCCIGVLADEPAPASEPTP